jgi:hypothetical protein
MTRNQDGPMPLVGPRPPRDDGQIGTSVLLLQWPRQPIRASPAGTALWPEIGAPRGRRRAGVKSNFAEFRDGGIESH